MSKYKVFIHMACYTVTIVAASYLLGVFVVSNQWKSQEKTEQDSKIYTSYVTSYNISDKRSINGDVQSTKAKWNIQCDNRGQKRTYLTFNDQINNIETVKIVWDNEPEKTFDVYTEDNIVYFSDDVYRYNANIINGLKKHKTVIVKIVLSETADLMYKWDLKNVASIINKSHSACFEKMSEANMKNYCILCNLAKENDIRRINYLINKGIVSIDKADQLGKTPIMYAARLDVAERILAAKPNLNHKDYSGKSVLWHLDDTNNYEIIKILIENGGKVADRDNANNTLLHQRVRNNNGEANDLKIMKLYINNGVDLNTLNKNDETPLMLSAKLGKYPMFEFFIHESININVKNKLGENLIHLAYANNKSSKDFKIIDSLLNLGLNINEKDNAGRNPLHKAIKNENYKLFEYLAQKGASITTQINGETLLHLAAKKSNSQNIIKLLLLLGLKINQKQNGNGDTPIFKAVRNNNYEIVKFLIDRGSDISIKTKGQKSLLAVAKDVRADLVKNEKREKNLIKSKAHYHVIKKDIDNYYLKEKEQNRKIINLFKQWGYLNITF